MYVTFLLCPQHCPSLPVMPSCGATPVSWAANRGQILLTPPFSVCFLTLGLSLTIPEPFAMLSRGSLGGNGLLKEERRVFTLRDTKYQRNMLSSLSGLTLAQIFLAEDVHGLRVFPHGFPHDGSCTHAKPHLSQLLFGTREKHASSFPPLLPLANYRSQVFQLINIRAYWLLDKLLQNLGVGLQPCVWAGGDTEGPPRAEAIRIAEG